MTQGGSKINLKTVAVKHQEQKNFRLATQNYCTARTRGSSSATISPLIILTICKNYGERDCDLPYVLTKQSLLRRSGEEADTNC